MRIWQAQVIEDLYEFGEFLNEKFGLIVKMPTKVFEHLLVLKIATLTVICKALLAIYNQRMLQER